MYFWSPVNTLLRRSTLFGFELASAALLRGGRRVSFSSHIVYSRPYGAAVIWPLKKKKCITNILAFRQKLEDPAPLFRVPIFDITCPTFLWRQLQSCRRILSHLQFSRELLSFNSTQYSRRYPLFLSGFSFYYIFWRVSSGSCLSQKVLCFIGATKFPEGLLWACEWCLGKYSLWIFFIHR